MCAKAGGVTQPWRLGSWWCEVRPWGVGAGAAAPGGPAGSCLGPGAWSHCASYPVRAGGVGRGTVAR